MVYTQVSTEERYRISLYRTHRFSIQKIADLLGRHRSTIYRELKRNAKPYDGYYRAEEASYKANARRWKSRRGTNFSKGQWKVGKYYHDGAPEQISNSFKELDLFNISHQTIYSYIKRDKKNGGFLHEHLRQAGKKRRKGYGNSDSRGVLRGKRALEEQYCHRIIQAVSFDKNLLLRCFAENTIKIYKRLSLRILSTVSFN